MQQGLQLTVNKNFCFAPEWEILSYSYWTLQQVKVVWICQWKGNIIAGKFRNLVHQKCLLTLYYSRIHLYLIYHNIIWGATYPPHLQKLYNLQKQFCRIATICSNTDHSAPLFNQLKILSIFNIYKYQTCGFVFEILHHPPSLPLSCCEFFRSNANVHNYNTRHAKCLHLPCSALDFVNSQSDIRGHSCGTVLSGLHFSLLLSRITNIGSEPVPWTKL